MGKVIKIPQPMFDKNQIQFKSKPFLQLAQTYCFELHQYNTLMTYNYQISLTNVVTKLLKVHHILNCQDSR